MPRCGFILEFCGFTVWYPEKFYSFFKFLKFYSTFYSGTPIHRLHYLRVSQRSVRLCLFFSHCASVQIASTVELIVRLISFFPFSQGSQLCLLFNVSIQVFHVLSSSPIAYRRRANLVQVILQGQKQKQKPHVSGKSN